MGPSLLLKDRLGRSLKDANAATDIWEILAAIKPELLAGGGGHRAAGPWAAWGLQGPKATGLGAQ